MKRKYKTQIAVDQALLRFGKPSYTGPWYERNIAHIKPPFAMYAGETPVDTIAFNKTYAKKLFQALNDIWIASGKSQKKIHEWGADRFDGTFVIRAIRGGKRLSSHAFAAAIDIDAKNNPLGSRKGRFTNNHPVVKAFKKQGFVWGGNFKGRKDPMHFSALGY